MKNVVLASASPRRKELLHQMGLEFEVCQSKQAENTSRTIPYEVVKELSYQKAKDVYSRGHKDSIVIGADTIVFHGGEIMGKPKNAKECKEMLRSLAGDAHHVFTGVTVLWEEDGSTHVLSFYEDTKVFVYQMSDAEINAYVATGEPLDKAGAYGIQGGFAKYIERIEGDYNNVVGLPIAKLYQELNKLGLFD